MPTNTKERNLSVLIVDDMSFIRKVVRKTLSDLGIAKIIEAPDAAEAVKRLRENKFDLIISDWNMPTMSGYDLLEFVRSHERFRTIPFLMLTANNDKESVINAAKNGVSDFLVKPFSAEDLEVKISKLIPPEK
jgi:two-component system, chemotaxis family, chemotaxis protein CheY